VPILDRLTRLYRTRGHEVVTGIPSRFTSLPFSEFTYVLSDDKTSPHAVGIAPAEIYFLEHLFDVYRPRSLFALGNGFGWSSFALALLNGEAQVVAMDAGVDEFSARWIALSNAIAAEEGLRLRVEKGVSPGDVAKVVQASFSAPVDFFFIDGEHTNEQVQLDFAAVWPHAHPRSVFLFHDVLFWDLAAGLNRIVAQSGLDAHVLWRTSTGMVLLCRDALHAELVELLKSFELGPKTAALFRALRQQAAAAAQDDGGGG
jgi:predicted O-methyltransferase YrrM